MHVKVESSWRTKALFALAFVLAGIIAWIETAEERAALEHDSSPAAAADAGPSDVVEMEIWEPPAE